MHVITSRIHRTAILIAIMLVACSGQDEAPETKVLSDYPESIEIAWPESPPELSWREVVRYGVEEGPNEQMLHGVSDTNLDEDGTIYISDAGNQRILVVSERGEHIRTIGRKGEGPGEFLSPSNITVGFGRLYVYDRPLSRISTFDLDGRLLSTNKVNFTPAMPRHIAVSSRDTLIIAVAETEAVGDQSIQTTRVCLWPVGEEDLIPIAESVYPVKEAMVIRGRRSWQIQPYPYDLVFDHGLNGVQVVVGLPVGEFRLNAWDLLTGDLAVTMRIDRPPIPVTVEDRERLRTRASTNDRRTEIARHYRFPATEPFFWNFRVDPVTNRIWVMKYHHPGAPIPEEGFEYSIISPEEGVVGVLRTPILVHAVVNNKAVGMTVDPDQDTQVVVIELQGTPSH